MNVKILALIGAVAFLPAAAGASAFTVLGATPAGSACYRAADVGDPVPSDLAMCDQAVQEAARHRDQIANLINRGIVRFKLGEIDGAQADFDAVLARETNQPDALINKAIVSLAAGGDVEAALAMLDLGLAGSPQRPWVGYYGRAVAHELAGRDRLAYRDYRMAEQLKPNWTLAKAALARFSRG
jgi:tetratricopeptide (TPR) repeat protein